MATAAARTGGVRYQEESLWLVPVALMAFGLFALAQALGLWFGLSPWSMISGNAHKALRMLPAVLAFAVIVQLILAAREAPHSPLPAFLRRIRRPFAHPWLAAARIAPLILMPVLFVGFSALKMLMPRFVPFWLDDSFAALDRTMFLGHQPWELTHWLFGSAAATTLIDRLYWMWILLVSIAIILFALFARREDRARFFLSATLAWTVLGVAGAWLGASAGPCYSALIGAASAPEFAGLLDRLQAISAANGGYLDAPNWQQVLWRAHASETYTFGMGISAMPSLHNAIAVLYALAAFRIGRLLGWFMSGYALIILVGSVHLGWHYAVDGIFGGIAMLLIWKGVDRWCRRSGYDDAVAADARPAAAPARA